MSRAFPPLTTPIRTTLHRAVYATVRSLLKILALLALLCGLQSPALAQFARPANTTLSAALGSAAPGNSSAAAVVQTEQVRAELLAYAPNGISPGAELWLGLQLTHQPHWHTYWKNPGDSGLATHLHWDLPPGLQAGDIAWPPPKKLRIGSLANFGFEGRVLLPVRVTIDPQFAPAATDSDVRVQLNASWLVCNEECVPQDGTFVLRLPLRGSSALHAGEFQQARLAAPQDLPGAAEVHVSANGLRLQVQGLPAAWHGKALNAFIEDAEIIDTPSAPGDQDALSTTAAASTGHQHWQADGSWSAVLPLSAQRTETPQSLSFVLARDQHSVRVQAPVHDRWPAVAAPTAAATTTPSAPGDNAPTTSALQPGTRSGAAPRTDAIPLTRTATLIPALLSALLGGLILNLMPCVFPVLAIKVLAFSKAHHNGGVGHRAEGLAYTAGVMLSFMALGGLLLALRAGGEQLGWGFQLQSPGVICFLALLFLLIGMNLMGWLEVGQMLPSGLANLQLRHPLGDAFLSGALAVAIASPCTAPFMGASLGYAIALPALQALVIFATLGLGLALPYLLASWYPSVERWMPRPGLWMDTLRRFMAFPMWATVVWLLWILGHLSGVDGAFALLTLLLGVSLLVWALRLQGRSRTAMVVLALVTLASLTATLGGSIFRLEDTPVNASSGDATNAPTGADATPHWQAWSEPRVAAALSAGNPVFVDFTAAWCITCQYNKRTTLANPDVLADFRARHVTLLRADWTRRDPVVSQALSALGRSGVPVYVLYRPGHPAQVLSEILTVDAVRGLLAQP